MILSCYFGDYRTFTFKEEEDSEENIQYVTDDKKEKADSPDGDDANPSSDSSSKDQSTKQIECATLEKLVEVLTSHKSYGNYSFIICFLFQFLLPLASELTSINDDYLK